MVSETDISFEETEALFRRLSSLGHTKYGIGAVSAPKHNFINLSVLLLLLLCLALLTCVDAHLSWPLVLATGVIYAYLFVVLSSLVPHEAGHAIFIKSESKRLAKFFGRLVCFPFGLSLSYDWKRNHFEHHRDPTGSEDPQLLPERILYGKELYRKALALGFIPGFPGVSRFAPMQYSKKDKELARLGALVFWGAAGWFLYERHQAMTTIAMLAGMGMSSGYGFFKESIEHQRDVPSIFRTRSYLYPLHQIWMPVHANYHFEHHLNSAVPWYNLPRFHETISPLIPGPIRLQLYDRSLRDLVKTAAGRTRDDMLAFVEAIVPPR